MDCSQKDPGLWVAKEVCRWASEWLSLGALVRASVNAN